MAGISRGRNQILYQFPLYSIARRGDSDYYEKVTAYYNQDSEDPTRTPPDPPILSRVKAAIEREAERFAATEPANYEHVLDNAILMAPMEARTEIFPATFYCTSCGRILHVRGRTHGAPPASADTKRKLKDFTSDKWHNICRACKGRVQQWQFATTHWNGDLLTSIEAWNLKCKDHGVDFLRVFGTKNPQLRDWTLRCKAEGCEHAVHGITGAPLSKTQRDGMPDVFGKTYQVRPIEASGTTIPRVVRVPLATRNLAAPTPGSSAAQKLVADLVKGGSGVASWHQRPTEEVQAITDYMASTPGTLPEDAESQLIELGVLSAAGLGDADPRASDADALEQAAILRALRAEGSELPPSGFVREAIHHDKVPISTVLYGYSRVGYDPDESTLRFYTNQTQSGGVRARLFYHTGPTEALVLRLADFDEPLEADGRQAIHTLSHALMRAIGEIAGFGETQLSEILLDHYGTVAIVPQSGQELVLKLLRNAWEDSRDAIVARAEDIVVSCPGDSYCSSQDEAACAQCIVTPWHSCGRGNADLDRNATIAWLNRPQ